MTSIFINYRSGDVPFAAAMLAAELVHRFGKPRIFLDGRSIEPGSDYRVALEDGVRRSSALLVLVGPQWTDPKSLRLLADENDWVRQEILHAWKHQSRVIPVLVERSHRIDAAKLPTELRHLANLQYLTLRSYHAHHDIDVLVTRLTELYPELNEVLRSGNSITDLQPSPRKDVDVLLRQILPAPQQWIGNRKMLTEVALFLVDSDDELTYLAPCHFSRSIPASAVALVTNTSLIVADLGERARVTQAIRVPRADVRTVALLPRRRLGVATADVDVHTIRGDVITIGGVLRPQGERLTDLLRPS